MSFEVLFVLYSVCVYLLGMVVGWFWRWYTYEYMPATEPEDEFEIEGEEDA